MMGYGLRPEDVVCGRDKLSHSHDGNRRFRKIIHAYRERYQTQKRREEKTKITAKIINMILSEGGRFLRMDEANGTWVELDAAAMHEKVSHSLRSARDPQRAKEKKKQQIETPGIEIQDEKLFEDLLAHQQLLLQKMMKLNEDSNDEGEQHSMSNGSDCWSFLAESV